MAKLAASLLADAKVGPIVADAHPDFEIAERAGAGKRVLIAINHGDVAHQLTLPAGATPVGGDWTDGRVAAHGVALFQLVDEDRSEEHTSELQSLMRISYAVFCLKKKTKHKHTPTNDRLKL